MNKVLYLGMPGSGKTTKLLQILETELVHTVPHQIAFVSFTRKAIQEAQQRCFEKLNVHRKEMPFFKTLHALAFSAMGLREHDVMNEKHLEELGKQIGFDLNSKKGKFNPISLYNLARAKKWSLFDTWHKTFLIHSKPFKLIMFAVQEYEAYKKRHDIIDFTDMIEQYNAKGAVLPVKIAFIDEAQDLSQMQWQMVNRAFANVAKLIVAGDDDQCIYAWSGADRKTFLNFDGRKEILNISYRCPAPVAQLGNSISGQIAQRYHKQLTGTDKAGAVRTILSLEECHEGFKNGEEWLILVRNRAHIDAIKRALVEQGLHFFIDNKLFCPYKHATAVLGYFQLVLGRTVDGETAKHIADCSGITNIYFEESEQYSAEEIYKSTVFYSDLLKQLRSISEYRLKYYAELMRNGQSFTAPKITVTTIHGAKGAECDNVILFQDQSKLTYLSAQIYPDNENRVFYVGVTRSKKNLFLFGARKKWHYNMPLNQEENLYAN